MKILFAIQLFLRHPCQGDYLSVFLAHSEVKEILKMSSQRPHQWVIPKEEV